MIRVGLGFDIHRTDKSRALFLGGVRVDSPFGLYGHSDADVLIHAIIDALLGAIAYGDIGDLFPDTLDCNKDRDSKEMLNIVVDLLHTAYKEKIKKSVASLLNIGMNDVSIKAKTYEKVGPIGESMAIESRVVALIKKEK